MINDEFKRQLLGLYTDVHRYSQKLLRNLKPEEYNWTPANTKARSVKSYLQHLVHTENFWLYALEKESAQFFDQEVSFEELMDSYKKVEEVYTGLLNKATESDLTIQETIYGKGTGTERYTAEQRGTLAWTILRLIIHGYGHISQVSHILFSLEVRNDQSPDYDPEEWWNVTEKLIAISKFTQENNIRS